MRSYKKYLIYYAACILTGVSIGVIRCMSDEPYERQEKPTVKVMPLRKTEPNSLEEKTNSRKKATPSSNELEIRMLQFGGGVVRT